MCEVVVRTPVRDWLRKLTRLLPAILSLSALIAILAGAPRAAAAQPAGMHPQALTDQVGLDRLRAACTADHAWLADLLKPFMERYVDGTVEWRGLGAYAGGRV